ncbi:hypothetical protein LINPERPRIM_LOCUS17646 [Linum perenne]
MAGEPPPKAAAAVDDDMGDGMQCSNHPYTSNPGGICAFCLQEKLGKLVSSSASFPLSAPSSSSSPPSFRSDHLGVNANAASAAAASLSLSVRPCAQGVRQNVPTTNNRNDNSHNSVQYNEQHYSKAKIPFLLARRKKKIMAASSSSSSSSENRDVLFKRSKSTTAAPGRRPTGQFFDDDDGYSPRKRRGGGFWSFLYHSASSNSKSNSNNSKRIDHHKVSSLPATASSSSSSPSANMPSLKKERCLGGSNLSRRTEMVAVEEEKEGEEEEEESPDNSQATADSVSNSSFERKVSRSRSVGCGSRSFSGDLFEKLSTGFGDCTLRRVESQREGGKSRVSGMKERVKCGGIFGGFIITSSSSSSSSAYWVSEEMNGKSATAAAHGRTRSWTWAFASPMRAFNTKPAAAGKDGKRETGNRNSAPNLAAIPSLLTVNS